MTDVTGTDDQLRQLEQRDKRIDELEARVKVLEDALDETFEQVYDNPSIDALIQKVLADS